MPFDFSKFFITKKLKIIQVIIIIIFIIIIIILLSEKFNENWLNNFILSIEYIEYIPEYDDILVILYTIT